MYMHRTTSGAAGNGLYTTIKYMRGAAVIGMSTTIKHLRRTTSGAAGNGLGVTMKYLRRTTSAAANNGLSTTIIPSCSVAALVVNSDPHIGALPSVRLCVRPELARCVHKQNPHQHTLYFASAVLNNMSTFKKNRGLSCKPVPPSPPRLRLKEHRATPAPLAPPEWLNP
jgi:hypothetical protein